MHFLIYIIFLFVRGLSYSLCKRQVKCFIESRRIFNHPLHISVQKFYSAFDDDFINEYREFINNNKEDNVTRPEIHTHISANQPDIPNSSIDPRDSFGRPPFLRQGPATNYSYSLNKKPKTVRKLLKPSSTASTAPLSLPSQDPFPSTEDKFETPNIKPIYPTATEHDTSSAYTWDIKPSEIKVKGAYFIKRYVQELREPFKRHPEDNSSPEFQIASLTGRIDYLIEHIKKSPKDNPAKRRLLKLAHRRRKLLTVLYRTNREIFQRVLDTFGLKFDTRPFGISRILPDYVYRRRKTTKRDYSKEGKGRVITIPPRFDNITLDSLIH